MQKMRNFLKKIAIFFIVITIAFLTNTMTAVAEEGFDLGVKTYTMSSGKFTEDVGPQGDEKSVGCSPDTGGTKLYWQYADYQKETFYLNTGPTDILLAGYLHAGATCYFSHYLYLPRGYYGQLEATSGSDTVNVYAYAVNGDPYHEADRDGKVRVCSIHYFDLLNYKTMLDNCKEKGFLEPF